MKEVIEVTVPDIGDYNDVPVIDVYVVPGDRVAADAPLATLESDKATMDIPAPVAGIVCEVLLKVGDRVAQGSRVVIIETSKESTAAAAAPAATQATAAAPPPAAAVAPSPDKLPGSVDTSPPQAFVSSAAIAVPPPHVDAAPVAQVATHASPSVRRLARELGVDLTRVPASGAKGRIVAEDVNAWVKAALTAAPVAAAAVPPTAASGATAVAGLTLAPWPQVDFAKYGAIETLALSKIQKMSAANLARNWVMIPAVTYHEDADISALEEFRQEINREQAKAGVKLTLLAFLIKASVAALQRHPQLNSSLAGDALILKKYYHIGFAADTPHGLVVPVIRDADKKNLVELAREAGALADRARAGKLTPAEMSGASFTISSLGGIGGTSFSPIVNAPEVAILGVNKAAMKPFWDGEKFVPQLTLPLSLSADHRVVDGALATRFLADIAARLADLRRILL